jgi:hypothetical protein
VQSAARVVPEVLVNTVSVHATAPSVYIAPPALPPAVVACASVKVDCTIVALPDSVTDTAPPLLAAAAAAAAAAARSEMQIVRDADTKLRVLRDNVLIRAGFIMTEPC